MITRGKIQSFICRWSDGTDVDYLKWGSGQPDDYQGQEACVEVHPLDVGKVEIWE